MWWFYGWYIIGWAKTENVSLFCRRHGSNLIFKVILIFPPFLPENWPLFLCAVISYFRSLYFFFPHFIINLCHFLHFPPSFYLSLAHFLTNDQAIPFLEFTLLCFYNRLIFIFFPSAFDLYLFHSVWQRVKKEIEHNYRKEILQTTIFEKVVLVKDKYIEKPR